MSERSQREAARLREKRKNPEYLAAEKAANAVRMAKKRKRRHRRGLCWDCDQPRLGDSLYCSRHRKYYRARRYYKYRCEAVA